MRLNQLPLRQATVITDVDWSALDPQIGRRLRDLGFYQGAEVEIQHLAPISHDPIACRVNNMLIAIRQNEAAVISVKPPVSTSQADQTVPVSNETILSSSVGQA
ncbi:MAG: FeoA family protein [Zymomonas mobilis subsp. pomaceae]|uniref:FeoA family protein n=1 Tax=Zymomonas mobilis subsp. pomaceae (strain ATCC 29192 / DSM 22645 / JCM 10191 / CCUG 17912 / NBRC 13757 / NCIMB 11200 / NRRL B-4491 / Barker I) TaxID=579138 RepID=F8EW44_ZYMMT|nr:FeoA family protein [Zymomonas mobilis]AEI38454.1 FeoA family protein [Zymomonas mobilis subsp. pomaceae ATCC 29192]MDX5948143.1 FeoA family protein [Zymomonas mobilis subsp. pomaceae]GEB89746.1 hypothetical protein ZMO02_13830 [Zymomonas mobilis subsp. pomaceae]